MTCDLIRLVQNTVTFAADKLVISRDSLGTKETNLFVRVRPYIGRLGLLEEMPFVQTALNSDEQWRL